MLKRSGTLIALAAGTTMLLMTHNVRAVETLPLRDSSDFNLQINGEVAPPAVFGNPTWTSDGDFITINNASVPAPGAMGWENVFNSATGYTVELRFRIVSPQVNGTGALGVILSDSSGTADYHSLVITASGINGIFNDRDFTDGFHVLRFVDKPGSKGISIWLDGELIVEDHRSALNFQLNRAFVGRIGSALSDGVAQIDYFRVDTTGAYRPIPEPASIAFLMVGSLSLIRRRRCL